MDNKNIILIIVAILILGVAGFLGYKYIKKQDSTMKEQTIQKKDMNENKNINKETNSEPIIEKVTTSDKEIDAELDNLDKDLDIQLDEEVQ